MNILWQFSRELPPKKNTKACIYKCKMKADLWYLCRKKPNFFDIFIIVVHKNIQIHLLFDLFISLFIIFHHNKDRINLYIFRLFKFSGLPLTIRSWIKTSLILLLQLTQDPVQLCIGGHTLEKEMFYYFSDCMTKQGLLNLFFFENLPAMEREYNA